MFRIPLNIVSEQSLSSESEEEIRRVIQWMASQSSSDIVFVITSRQNERIYQIAKRELLGNGIPNQVVRSEKLNDPKQLPWILENIALASYAKIGGTPWVVASDKPRRELVIGISRAQDYTKRFVVGFVTLFNQDGDFLFLNSSAPVLEWEQGKYAEGLGNLIMDAYKEYEAKNGTPEAIILHLCKRPGRFREVEAIQRAFQHLDTSVPYALVHINDDSSYRLFDFTHPTYIPPSGLKVELSQRNVLLLLDGRIGDKRTGRGVPTVLDVSFDHRSPMSPGEFPRLVRQIYDFARVNWRGFNARAVPVTLNYSHLIAHLIVEIGTDAWNQVISMGRLRDKAWFL